MTAGGCQCALIALSDVLIRPITVNCALFQEAQPQPVLAEPDEHMSSSGGHMHQIDY